MNVAEFITMPVAQVADLVRAQGPKVCAFPINGTRRWFLLEYPPHAWNGQDFLSAYHEKSVTRQLEIYRLFFDHGLDTLMMPLFGPDLLERGGAYVRVMAYALEELAAGSVFRDFYREYGVRVRFYGDHRKYLAATPYSGLSDLFDRVSLETAHHDRCRLLYGVFGNDATETTAELGVRYFKEHGTLPDRAKLVELYYGEYIPPVSLFIGFDRFAAFDMPLLATGSEDLYFTVSPSFYITQDQLRRILFDHLYARRVEEQDYEKLSPQAVQYMADFYRLNRDRTLGVGDIYEGFWYPVANVELPDVFVIEPER